MIISTNVFLLKAEQNVQQKCQDEDLSFLNSALKSHAPQKNVSKGDFVTKIGILSKILFPIFRCVLASL